jgi:hypothetical protein
MLSPHSFRLSLLAHVAVVFFESSVIFLVIVEHKIVECAELHSTKARFQVNVFFCFFTCSVRALSFRLCTACFGGRAAGSEAPGTMVSVLFNRQSPIGNRQSTIPMNYHDWALSSAGSERTPHTGKNPAVQIQFFSLFPSKVAR